MRQLAAEAICLHLLRYHSIPYDVPLWRDVTVHPDQHVSVRYALYWMPNLHRD